MAEGVYRPHGIVSEPLALETPWDGHLARVSRIAQESLHQVPQEPSTSLDPQRITLVDPSASPAQQMALGRLLEELRPDRPHELTQEERKALVEATKEYLGALLPPNSTTLQRLEEAITICKVSSEGEQRQGEEGRPLSRCVILSAPRVEEGKHSAPLHIIDLWGDPSSSNVVQGFHIDRGGSLFDRNFLADDYIPTKLKWKDSSRNIRSGWSVEVPTNDLFLKECASVSPPLKELLDQVRSRTVEVLTLPEKAIPGGICHPIVVQGIQGKKGGSKVLVQGVELNLVERWGLGLALEESMPTMTLSTKWAEEASVLEAEARVAYELAEHGVAVPPPLRGNHKKGGI